jgi:hypothetical protein
MVLVNRILHHSNNSNNNQTHLIYFFHKWINNNNNSPNNQTKVGKLNSLINPNWASRWLIVPKLIVGFGHHGINLPTNNNNMMNQQPNSPPQQQQQQQVNTNQDVQKMLEFLKYRYV